MAKGKRRCSLCRKQGHNKRTCPEVTQPKKAQKATPVVRLVVEPEQTESQYIVDLAKNKEPATPWHEITAYAEQPRERTERVTVNFASLIRAHKANEQRTRLKTAPPVQKRKRIRPSLPSIALPSVSLPTLSVGHMTDRVSKWTGSLRDRLFSQRTLATALALLLVALIPFPAMSYYAQVQQDGATIVAQSTDAFLALQSSTIAALNANVPQAQYDVSLALSSFGRAHAVLDEKYGTLARVAAFVPLVGKHVSARTSLLEAGHAIALGNTYLIKGVGDATATGTDRIADKLEILNRHLSAAVPQYERALHELASIDESVLPDEYQGLFSEFELLYAAFLDDVEDLVDLTGALIDLSGHDGPRTYLVIGQNSQELRPTGGFMGSFAIVTVQKGRVTRVEVPEGGTYDIQGQIKEYIKPPLPLQIVNKRWEFQDANWYPDFAASAEHVASIYERAWGESIDGVVAVNVSVLDRLLSVLGPVTTDDGVVLSAGSSAETLRAEIDDAAAAGDAPKSIIGDGLTAILGQLAQPDSGQLVRLLVTLGQALDQREIQMYTRDPVQQPLLQTFGWTGTVQQTGDEQDYLFVVNTNTGGGKSDARIQQTISHQAYVDPVRGEIIDTVVIERTHTGTEDETFYGAANLSYVRAYVPQGAQLLEAGGFDFPPEDAFLVPDAWATEDEQLLATEKEIDIDKATGTRITHEFGKTAFGNWMAVGPGETARAFFVYKLPFTLLDPADIGSPVQQQLAKLVGSDLGVATRYSLFVQKQSGIESQFASTIIYPDGWRPVWRTRDDLSLAANGAMFSGSLDTDQLVGIVLEQE